MYATRRTGGGRRVYTRVHDSLGAALADARRGERSGRAVEILEVAPGAGPEEATVMICRGIVWFHPSVPMSDVTAIPEG
jgi:hypothetical protein